VYCPNCASTLQSGATECPACRASFAEGAAWGPVATPPVRAAKRKPPATDPFAVAFSGKALLLFMLLGPLVAFLGVTAGAGQGSAFFLVSVYVVGSVLALFAWAPYSFALATLYVALVKYRGSLVMPGPLSAMALGAIAGAVPGFMVWSMFRCMLGRSAFGGWGSCFAASLFSDFPVSVAPGAICGALACVWWCSRRPSATKPVRAVPGRR
jgi:hypothetical protein